MSGDATVSPPAVLWAQRNLALYVTICLEDCRDPVLQINPTNIYFRGVGGTERKEHEVDIELYKEIVPELTKQFQTGRTIELVLKKKEEDVPYWPQLTKLKQRYHWLKINFSKWKDEEDSDREEEEDFNDMIRSIGGYNQNPRFNCPEVDNFGNDIDFEDDDESDEDDLPPLE